jgi:hypothetical protein
VDCADTQLGHPAAPVRLVHELGHDCLGRAGHGGGRGRTGAAVMHDRGDPGEQRLVVDLTDHEAVVPVVDRGQAGPAASED